MNKHTTFCSLVFILLVSLTTNCWALGKTGHRVTGQIAFNHLSDKAREEVEKLLGSDSLAEVSNWPDFMRSDKDKFWQKLSTSWHYVSIPDNTTYAASQKNPKGDIYLAINTFKAILADREVPRGIIRKGLESYFGDLDNPAKQQQIKRFALKFLMHLVGDIHQPLHVGYAKDQGGNKIKVKWFWENSNLHRVWDSQLIDYFQLSYTEMVEYIDIKDAMKIKKIQQAAVEQWMAEAMSLRVGAYKIGDGKLGYDYIYAHSEDLNQQLVKAGLRMAKILNDIYQ